MKRLARRLLAKGQNIDVFLCNAGIGGWKGLDWFKAVWSVMVDMPASTTYPTYKLGHTGRVLRPEIPVREGGKSAGKTPALGDETPVLGETFTANVFGHYMLAHWLMPVLQPTKSGEASRIIWISSIEAYGHTLDPNDMQGLKTSLSYESSKRLTDVLALSSELPSTRPWVQRYLASTDAASTSPNASSTTSETGPRILVCHPGICATSIFDLPLILQYAMLAAFYVSRWIGSPWHPISAYLGSVAAVWLALIPEDILESVEGPLPARSTASPGSFDDDGEQGKGKWGSSTDRVGSERVIRTEVEGWGWSGRVGELADGGIRTNRGRYRGMKALTEERKEEFEETGRRVWKEMEDLRSEWEERLRDVE